MIYYAVLNKKDICTELRGLHKEVDREDYILLETEDFSVLGKRYNIGEWETVQRPEPAESELARPTEQEFLQAEILLNQQQIISKQKEIDMTLAELLLNQQGVSR